jgi:hypothetical protein
LSAVTSGSVGSEPAAGELHTKRDVARSSGETNPKIRDSNPNESFAYFEKDSHESDSNPTPPQKKSIRHLLMVQRPLNYHKIAFGANPCIKIRINTF